MSSLVCAGVRSVAGKISRSALVTRTSRPPASTKTSSERAMASEDARRPAGPAGSGHLGQPVLDDDAAAVGRGLVRQAPVAGLPDARGDRLARPARLGEAHGE